jgi:hypothetical protein
MKKNYLIKSFRIKNLIGRPEWNLRQPENYSCVVLTMHHGHVVKYCTSMQDAANWVSRRLREIDFFKYTLTMKKDFLGRTLKIGDHVIMVRQSYREFVKAVIVGETPEYFRLSYKNTSNYEREIIQRPNQLILIENTAAES